MVAIEHLKRENGMDFLPSLVSSKTEMASFIYGAIFVVLGLQVISHRMSAISLPLAGHLWLLGAFGMLHGVSEWFLTLSSLFHSSGWTLWLHLALEWVSWACLAEFGRRVWLEALDREEYLQDYRSVFGPLLHLPPVLIFFPGLFFVNFDLPLAHAILTYLIAVPASLIAAAGIAVSVFVRGEELAATTSREYLLVAALGFAILGILATNPGSGTNALLGAKSSGAVAADASLALLRGFSALLLVFCLGRTMALFNAFHRRKIISALRLESRRSKMILDAAAEGILEVDKKGVISFINPAAADMLGTRPDLLVGRHYHAAIHHSLVDGSPNPPGNSPILNAIRRGEIHRGNNQVFIRADGSSFSVEHACMPVLLDGELQGAVLTFSDISERLRITKLLRVTQGMAHIGGWELRPDSKTVSWTDEVFRIHELPLDFEISTDAIHEYFHGSARRVFDQALTNAIQAGESFDLELCLVTARNNKKWVRVIGQPYQKSATGFAVTGTYQDVTERVLYQRKLRDNRDFYELILDSVPIRIAHIDARMHIGYANHSYEKWFGKEKQSMHGKHVSEIMSPEGFAEARPNMERALRGESVSFQVNPARDGVQYRLAVHYLPHISRNGEVLGFFSVVQDMTEFKQLEEKLIQAQKMEAVGQLTGGLAHDFNNLLGVIVGNLQLLERPLRDDEKLHRKVKTATRAAMRGADLTRRLLAFSRRQMLEPKVVDLHHLVDNLNELVRRTLGEGIDISTDFPDSLWSTFVDPSQLETAILNLSINARDAMPTGGALRIACENVSLGSEQARELGGLLPGDYVTIKVSDSGHGMTREVLRQVFEPFFTTKEVGKGSGLGLSMVYGFAEQSGGAVTIDSEPYMGTTVSIYLPRAEVEIPDAREETAIHRFMPGGDECILVVDDEDDVRETVISLLHELGYQTLEANNGPNALEVIRQNPQINLLLSDIRMPGGMHGPALAKRVRVQRPDMKVMFTSGYSGSEPFKPGDLVSGSELLKKPYKNEELAMKIRLMLDRNNSDERENAESAVGH
jgi:PAS domain S-box-containing protein